MHMVASTALIFHISSSSVMAVKCKYVMCVHRVVQIGSEQMKMLTLPRVSVTHRKHFCHQGKCQS